MPSTSAPSPCAADACADMQTVRQGTASMQGAARWGPCKTMPVQAQQARMHRPAALYARWCPAPVCYLAASCCLCWHANPAPHCIAKHAALLWCPVPGALCPCKL
jgi:hypothetical protein